MEDFQQIIKTQPNISFYELKKKTPLKDMLSAINQTAEEKNFRELAQNEIFRENFLRAITFIYLTAQTQKELISSEPKRLFTNKLSERIKIIDEIGLSTLSS